ncbi:hypothetical protein Tco_0492147 [Tanacetum coccineum]
MLPRTPNQSHLPPHEHIPEMDLTFHTHDNILRTPSRTGLADGTAHYDALMVASYTIPYWFQSRTEKLPNATATEDCWFPSHSKTKSMNYLIDWDVWGASYHLQLCHE